MRKKSKRGRPKGSKNSYRLDRKLKEITPEKAELIRTIWKLQPKFKRLEIDLTKYSISQLQKHIDIIKKKRRK